MDDFLEHVTVDLPLLEQAQVENQRIGYAKHLEAMPFCSICQHRVHDMEKHIQSKDHKRQARKQIDRETGPRLLGQSRSGNDEAQFPGHLRLRRSRVK